MTQKYYSEKRTKSRCDAVNRRLETPPEECRHCRRGEETFQYLQQSYIFDVERARAIVQDGRESLELEPDDVRYSVDGGRIYPEHLSHVDPRCPGIVAHLWYEQPDGEIIQGQLLIDGHHRAARCLELELPYFIHLLSEAESREIMLKTPAVYERLAQR